MVSAAQQRLLDILDYWHKIEFFIPFDLSQVTDIEDAWKLRWIRSEHLAQWPAAFSQPFDIPAHLQVSGFRLYLGLFDRSEIAAICKRVLPAVDGDEDENEERGAMAGMTCFARFDLNVHGEPAFDPVSVSTVPWALGRTMSEGIGSLGAQAFEAAQQDLRDRLKEFRSERAPAAPVVPGGPAIAPLTGADIVALSDLLTGWAGFTPAPGQPVLLEIVTSRRKEDGKEAGKNNGKSNGEQPDRLAAHAAGGSQPAYQADVPANDPTNNPADNRAQNQLNEQSEEPEEPAEPAVDILNSFFIADIEHAMDAVRAGEAPLLATYLTPLAQDQRIDVYTSAGRRALLDQLHPARGNRGHWLSQSAHSMSLMQQFAINAGQERLRDGGLFAVNGPPGTGKTTLLREIFADNIVRRAAVLAQLPSAAAAFDGRVRVTFADGKNTTIRTLRPELTGFEMVVASSNNAAVENISRDLPKRKSLGEDWQDIGYLRSVSDRIASEDEKGYFVPTPETATWGLISCSLGNSSNRYRFVSKFYHPNWNDKVKPDSRCQNVREWMDGYRGPGFAQAAAEFRLLAEQVEAEIADLAAYANCWQQFPDADTQNLRQAEHDALALATEAARVHGAAQGAVQELLVFQADLREEERLLDRERPAWWARWFKPAVMRRYRDDCAANAGAQRALLRQVAAAREAEAAALARQQGSQAAVAAAQAAVAQHERQRQVWQQQMAQYRERYACQVPASADELEQDAIQIAGLWHDQALARLRSRLFAAALALHEAWLAEVGRPGSHGFGGNLFALAQLLTNNRPDRAEHVPLIWQSLFMVVPVVSTTFASLARQFRDMGAGSLGWLFIDEAGQSVPQAAVGGLWRARRAVVVGDPLQIEPVFTVPLTLIRSLSAQSPHTAAEDYAPDKISVQRLADSANRHGTLVPQPDGQGLWIGSPLRVHRRCADPMFSLANTIAYGGKMVIEPARRRPAPLKVAMGDSAWIDIGGQTVHKQVVPAQIEFVADVLLALYRHGGALPDLYVISPFKAVREELRKRIMELAWQGTGKPPSKAAVRAWCKASVGTVHTFQGKEQAAVLMVLGVDADNAGSAAWAAAKPNLLNVALTRAQQHFYMIGAGEVWRDRAYFGAAYATLPKRTPEQFLAGIG